MIHTAFTIYNASAGSGKTFTLVKEYLKIILKAPSDEAYKRILAITFTNKAVKEMKNRVLNTLHDFSISPVNQRSEAMLGMLAEELNISEEKIQEKSSRIIKQIIYNYAGFDISTIDKFTHRVIRTFATDLNLSPNFQVSLDTKAILQEAVDAVIAQAGTEEEITKLLLDFSLYKSEQDKSWDISHELFSIGELLLKENNIDEIESLKKVSSELFIQTRDELHIRIKEAENQTKELALNLLEWLENQQIDLNDFSRKYFPNHLEKISLGTFNPNNKLYNTEDSIKVKKGAKSADIVHNILPQIIEKVNKIYHSYGKSSLYQNILNNLTPLALLNRIHQEMERIQQEQNILSINKFNTIIHDEIKQQPAPFIYERIGERYRHYFIDEFQDTSEMQWANLLPLIDNALSGQDTQGNPGSLMIVGDPKQSIYRWRGGKAEQFITLSQHKNPFSNPDKKVVHLDTNYRSYSEIVDFNNQFFAFISGLFQQPDYKKLYAEDSFQKNNTKNGGYVEFRFIDKSDADDDETANDLYLKATLETIKKALANGFSYKDMVVLTRKVRQGVAIANFLTENNVPILSSETLLINNSSDVQLLILLLKYSTQTNDADTKAKWLYQTAQHQNEMPVHDFITQGLPLKDTELEQWLHGFGINVSFDYVRKTDLYTAVEYLAQQFIPETKKYSYVQYFMDVVLEHSTRYHSSSSDFIRYWEQNYERISIPAPENSDAVKIMTIHKSKGLEFPVVIFPFANEKLSDTRDKIWVDLPKKQFDLPKGLINQSKQLNFYGQKIQQHYEEKKEEYLFDVVNILYVALTRAVEQLYIITENPGKTINNPTKISDCFALYLENKHIEIPEDKIVRIGNPQRVSIQKEEQEPLRIIESIDNNFRPDNIKIAKRTALLWNNETQTAIDEGNQLHRILAKISSEKDIEKSLQTALLKGEINPEDKIWLNQIIQQIVNHQELQHYFDSEKTIYNERMILSEKNLIPDKMVFDGKNAYLLDYKTGQESKKHHQQIESYADILESMGYSVVQKTLIYIRQDDIKVIHL
ncbi:UvrD-helicase domain-containing protein [Avrilella dinanensis]|uniref:UvrD-helicase domain-containing protein n=1 Tax=Avrilella dinanensis TaxID=2008672 RepID=UPI00240A6306|nr:UvrD-helicase domain-containing protein [Avrilella dinanensis]